jgi:hypothetical protein
MTGASAHTAAGGCLTDRTVMPALPMPYNGGRVDSASRTFSPDEGRGAYAKWHLRSSAAEQRWNTQGVDTERPLRRQRLDAGKYPLPRTRLEARFNHVSIVFTGMTAAHSQFTNFLHWKGIASQAQPSASKPSSTLDRRTPQSK